MSSFAWCHAPLVLTEGSIQRLPLDVNTHTHSCEGYAVAECNPVKVLWVGQHLKQGGKTVSEDCLVSPLTNHLCSVGARPKARLAHWTCLEQAQAAKQEKHLARSDPAHVVDLWQALQLTQVNEWILMQREACRHTNHHQSAWTGRHAKLMRA